MGGSHISAIDYIVELKKKKIETKVLLFKKNSYLEKYLNLKCIDFETINLPIYKFDKNILNNFFFLILAAKDARNYLKKNKISIVHTNDIRNHYSWSVWSLFLSDVFGIKEQYLNHINLFFYFNGKKVFVIQLFNRYNKFYFYKKKHI